MKNIEEVLFKVANQYINHVDIEELVTINIPTHLFNQLTEVEENDYIDRDAEVPNGYMRVNFDAESLIKELVKQLKNHKNHKTYENKTEQ